MHDLFLDSTSGLGRDALFWSYFFILALVCWVLPVYLSARWVLARYNVLASASHEDALIPVKDWVCRLEPGGLAVACLVALLIGQFEAALTTPEMFAGKDEALEAISNARARVAPGGRLLLHVGDRIP